MLSDPSIDNYYAFFKELKEKNNTKEAFTAAGSLSELDTIFDEAFGNTSTWIKNSDGTYSYFRVTEGEKNKLEFYAKLFKEGLLDNEFLTKQWDTKERAFYDGEAAVISGTQGKVIDLYNTHMTDQNGADAKLMVLPPAKGVGQGYNPIDVSKEGRGFAISILSKHKKEAFALMEFLATQEGQILDKLGEEGVQYEISNNKIKLLPAFKDWYERFWGATINFKPEYPFDESTPFLSKVAEDSLNKVKQYGTSDNAFIIPQDLSAKMDACKAIYTEFAADVVTGKKSIDEFDSFVKNFMDNGGKDITDYANKQLMVN
ncbi:MAG: extracellular solute-binding protein [Oscillospiraceae bacterium]|nr:extracellular solute-binding protein [Oscillospiraceae bacterium]